MEDLSQGFSDFPDLCWRSNCQWRRETVVRLNHGWTHLFLLGLSDSILGIAISQDVVWSENPLETTWATGFSTNWNLAASHSSENSLHWFEWHLKQGNLFFSWQSSWFPVTFFIVFSLNPNAEWSHAPRQAACTARQGLLSTKCTAIHSKLARVALVPRWIWMNPGCFYGLMVPNSSP